MKKFNKQLKNFIEELQRILNLPQEIIAKEVGLINEDFAGKNNLQKEEMIAGEYFAKIAKNAGKIAYSYLIHVQWGYKTPDWFDHRLHLLDTEKQFNDFWTASANNILRVFPYNGTLLNLCSGDGFYDYYFFKDRAKEIVCIDNGREVYRHACRLHKAKNIIYHLENVLTYQPKESYYDVVLIRGAIEHFTQANQQIIFKKALKALKLGGWFCGDTPARKTKGNPAHENEWANETEMRQELKKVFNYIETYTMKSTKRLILFWRCKKI